ncbi:uncharacterized protein [Periplaneta americana]|uniref:uncharacterized protein n=1 Tax=Periplaneta americana TaxID=6978 RepID=UPI0037E95F83
MAKLTFLMLGVVTVAFLLNEVLAWSPVCYGPGEECPVSPSFCCGGCCKNGVCIQYDDDPDYCSGNVCAHEYCPKGQECHSGPPLKCSRPPCRLSTVCKPKQ